MKTLLTSLIAFLAVGWAVAQGSLSEAEYYIDHDPGYGNATSVVISGTEFDLNQIIEQSLDFGQHTIYLRAKDEDGVWGPDEAIDFLVVAPVTTPEWTEIVEVEYFFNHDPGYGQATSLSVESEYEVAISELMMNDLPFGMNSLTLRSKTADGTWGIDHTTFFIHQETPTNNPNELTVVVGYEYYIDEDPGFGEAFYVDVDANAEAVIQDWIETTDLENGTYKLAMRGIDDQGNWGMDEWIEFEYLNCESTPVTLEGPSEFCSEWDEVLTAPEGFDAWYWNTQELTELIYLQEGGTYNVSVYDEENHQCFHSNDLEIEMFEPIEPSFETVVSFEDATFTSNVEGLEYLWTIDGTDFTSDPVLQFGFAADGEHEVCLTVTNICGTYQHCETIIICSEYEVPPYFYLDSDGDGFGAETDSIQACTLPEGYASNNTDCDDSDAGINPDAVEIEGDEIDQNCDGDDFVNGLTTLSESEFRVYPNPTNDIVNIAFDRGFNGTIQVFDMRGKRVFHQDLVGTLQLPIDLSNLSTGFYVLRVHNDQVQAMRRISVL